MSDWEFLWDMRDEGYSADEISEAAACGYNPFSTPKKYLSTYLDDEFDDEYFDYLRSAEAKAISFTRRYLPQAKGCWVDMLAFREYPSVSNVYSSKFPNYSLVLCELYEKRILPQYPSEFDFEDELMYYRAIRRITWETANKDIEQQKSEGVKPPRFKLIGYNDESKNTGYFRDDAPPEIKALANNLNDKTNPLWDKAHRYFNKNFNGSKFVCTVTAIDY